MNLDSASRRGKRGSGRGGSAVPAWTRCLRVWGLVGGGALTTIGQLWESYRDVILSRVSAGTGRSYIYAWKNRVAPSFADRKVETLTALDIEVAMTQWTGKASTKSDALATLSQICKTAMKAGLISSNPTLGVERPRVQDRDPASRALTADEVGRLLAVLPPDGPYRRFVLAMLFTGCRLGEVAALRVSDVDWSNMTIRVSRTASPGLRGEITVGPTKGRRVRRVPVPDPFAPLVDAAMEGKGEHDLLFPGPRGGFLSSKNLSRALKWHSVRDSVKTFPPGEPKLHWHDLRHTAAVMAFLAGLSAPDVQAILGHATLAVTQLYADTRNSAAIRAASALSSYYSPQSIGQLLGGGEGAVMHADLDF